MSDRYQIAKEQLSPREKTFAEHYVQCNNGTQAATEAGYKAGCSAQKAGIRLPRRPAVAEYIEELRQAMRPHSWSPREIVQRLQDIADSKEAKHADKVRSLELLGRAHAMFTDKIKVDLPRRIVVRAPEGEVIDNLDVLSPEQSANG